MKILKRAVMPDGTEIQLEHWDKGGFNSGLAIGAYPMAKNTGKYRHIKSGEAFRLDIHANKYRDYLDSDVRNDFEALKNAEKTLQDLSNYFWNGKKDMWYLGMDVEYEGW